MPTMDAIAILKGDHKTVEQLFKRFEKAGDRAHIEKADIVNRVIEALSVHAAIEEQLFYPVARATVPGTEDIALESLEEHHIVKWVLSELQSMTPQDERFDAKVTVLIENVRHHVKEEEEEFFPMVRNELGRTALRDLGEALVTAKKVAPTHPHPRSPDTPPGNLAVGTSAGVADRIGDAVNGLAQGSVTAVGDVIALVLGRKKPRVSPTGSEATQTTATQVRSGASEATEAAIETIRTAKETGKRVLHTAGSSAQANAKSTSRSTKQGARNTTRAANSRAKRTATSTKAPTARSVANAKRAVSTTAQAARPATKSKTAKHSRSTSS